MCHCVSLQMMTAHMITAFSSIKFVLIAGHRLRHYSINLRHSKIERSVQTFGAKILPVNTDSPSASCKIDRMGNGSSDHLSHLLRNVNWARKLMTAKYLMSHERMDLMTVRFNLAEMPQLRHFVVHLNDIISDEKCPQTTHSVVGRRNELIAEYTIIIDGGRSACTRSNAQHFI